MFKVSLHISLYNMPVDNIDTRTKMQENFGYKHIYSFGCCRYKFGLSFREIKLFGDFDGKEFISAFKVVNSYLFI